MGEVLYPIWGIDCEASELIEYDMSYVFIYQRITLSDFGIFFLIREMLTQHLLLIV